jgi:hypothetical protein
MGCGVGDPPNANKVYIKKNPVLPVLTKKASVLYERVQSFQRNSILPEEFYSLT